MKKMVLATLALWAFSGMASAGDELEVSVLPVEVAAAAPMAVPAPAGGLDLKSASVLVVEQTAGRTLYAKNTTAVVPIASITKLMTAMVVLDSGLDLAERIAIAAEDVDALRNTRSRLQVGTVLTRDDLMRLALMSSENRAAAALARAYPGGTRGFVRAMNQKAAELGMKRTRFVESTGLASENVSSAEDLVVLVAAAYRYPVIQHYTTLTGHTVRGRTGRTLVYTNSNGLVRSPDWHIGVSKTGFISEAGRCLVMQARIGATPVVIVLLDSWGRYTRVADAIRIKKWIESTLLTQVPG